MHVRKLIGPAPYVFVCIYLITVLKNLLKKLGFFSNKSVHVYTIRGVDPFFGLGGGGGKSKENFTFFGALCVQNRRKIKNCVCLVVFLCLI